MEGPLCKPHYMKREKCNVTGSSQPLLSQLIVLLVACESSMLLRAQLLTRLAGAKASDVGLGLQDGHAG